MGRMLASGARSFIAGEASATIPSKRWEFRRPDWYLASVEAMEISSPRLGEAV